MAMIAAHELDDCTPKAGPKFKAEKGQSALDSKILFGCSHNSQLLPASLVRLVPLEPQIFLFELVRSN